MINKSINLVGENRETAIIDGMSNGTVVYVGSDNVSISDFKLQYSGCSCSDYYGVDVGSSRQNVSIINNNIFSDSTGILVRKGRDIRIVQNNITHSGDYPILIEDSIGISMFENDVEDNLNQIYIQNSTQLAIVNNKVMSNGNGITLTNSNNNTLAGNIIASNSLYGLYLSQSDYNMIVRNSLQSNARNVYVRNSTEYWDNGSEGNYWSNYTSTDANNDGIGDNPFVLDANNTDNHPLMGPFSSYPATPQNDVGVATDSTIDSFEYIPPDTIRLQVSNTTAEQTTGFCRIIIPHALIDPDNGKIQVIIDSNQTQILYLNTTLYDNGTHRWVYFAFPLSTHEILIIPEYHSFLIISLVVITLTLVVVIKRKRRIEKMNVRQLD